MSSSFNVSANLIHCINLLKSPIEQLQDNDIFFTLPHLSLVKSYNSSTPSPRAPIQIENSTITAVFESAKKRLNEFELSKAVIDKRYYAIQKENLEVLRKIENVKKECAEIQTLIVSNKTSVTPSREEVIKLEKFNEQIKDLKKIQDSLQETYVAKNEEMHSLSINSRSLRDKIEISQKAINLHENTSISLESMVEIIKTIVNKLDLF